MEVSDQRQRRKSCPKFPRFPENPWVVFYIFMLSIRQRNDWFSWIWLLEQKRKFWSLNQKVKKRKLRSISYDYEQSLFRVRDSRKNEQASGRELCLKRDSRHVSTRQAMFAPSRLFVFFYYPWPERETVQRRKWSRGRKWSPTATDPQFGPQMIPEPQMIPTADRKWSR